MTDVLTREQLIEQKKKRETYLKYLKQTCADEKIIRAAEKDLKLTERRLERMKDEDSGSMRGIAGGYKGTAQAGP